LLGDRTVVILWLVEMTFIVVHVADKSTAVQIEWLLVEVIPLYIIARLSALRGGYPLLYRLPSV
jgi:hypothetical protein